MARSRGGEKPIVQQRIDPPGMAERPGAPLRFAGDLGDLLEAAALDRIDEDHRRHIVAFGAPLCRTRIGEALES
jgi:hypothetical protein